MLLGAQELLVVPGPRPASDRTPDGPAAPNGRSKTLSPGSKRPEGNGRVSLLCSTSSDGTKRTISPPAAPHYQPSNILSVKAFLFFPLCSQAYRSTRRSMR
jgi:hypothetical protein